MAIPVYLWLKDDGGADIKGSVDVKDREGSIEVVAQEHNLYIPTDNNTGKLTGTRIHTPFLFTKEIDSSSPYLYKAVTTGQTLKSAEFKWYKINDAGQEVEYFNTMLPKSCRSRELVYFYSRYRFIGWLKKIAVLMWGADCHGCFAPSQ